jgi:hypothetical protein
MNKSSDMSQEQLECLNDALDEICRKVDADTLRKRTNVEDLSDLVTKQQYQDIQVILFKRLLLQTPLLFWPAIFQPGISRLVDEPPSVTGNLGTQSDPCFECVNNHKDRGYEVLVLWEKVVQSQPISFEPEDVKSECYLRFPSQ